MARNQNRQQITAKAAQARRPARSGGTSAPRSAARGGRSGINTGKVRDYPRWDRGGKWNVTGTKTGKTQYTPGPGGSAGAMAPQASTPTPTPWNTKAEEIVSGARRNYLNQGIGFDLSEQQAKQEFGLDQGFNDYKANPFSRAALLQENYLNANRGTVNSAGNQFYAGSTSNALGANRKGYDFNRNELASVYRDALGEISGGRAKASEEKAEREREAEWERIAAAEGAPLESEAAPGEGGRGKKKKSQPKGKGEGTIAPWPPKKKGKK